MTARSAMSDSPARYAALSVVAAVATIALKSAAWALTGSVGLLSDAAGCRFLFVDWGFARPNEREELAARERVADPAALAKRLSPAGR